MKKYIKKYMIVFGLSILCLTSAYGCKTNTSQEGTKEVESEEEVQEEMIEEVTSISDEYIPESTAFKLPLPGGNWIVEREEEEGTSLQAEDGQSYIEIAYLTQEDVEAALGEVPETKEQLEEFILVGEVHPTVISFERNVKGDIIQTTYTLKYEDGDYPYMTQSTYETKNGVYTIIGMTQSTEEKIVEEIQEKINQFEALNQ